LPRSRVRRPRYRGRAIVRRRRASFHAAARVVIAALLLGGLGTGAYFALTSPKLVVKQVRIIGAKRDLPARLIRSLSPGCVGKNILLVNKRKLFRLAKQEPEVERAYIRRSFPRTIVVRIQERAPYAVAQTGGASYLVDASGFAFRTCAQASSLGLPVVRVAGSDTVSLGQPCRDGVRTALRCIDRASTFGLKVRKISVDPAGDMCLNVVSGFYVKIGSPVKLDRKLDVLGKMLDGRPEMFRRIEYVDVSNPEAPAIKPTALAAE